MAIGLKTKIAKIAGKGFHPKATTKSPKFALNKGVSNYGKTSGMKGK